MRRRRLVPPPPPVGWLWSPPSPLWTVGCGMVPPPPPCGLWAVGLIETILREEIVNHEVMKEESLMISS